MMDNRELFDEVADTYKREVVKFTDAGIPELTRRETLRAVFLPMLLNYYEWKRDPSQYAPCDFDRMIDQFKKGYDVTPEEWADVEEQYGLAGR